MLTLKKAPSLKGPGRGLVKDGEDLEMEMLRNREISNIREIAGRSSRADDSARA